MIVLSDSSNYWSSVETFFFSSPMSMSTTAAAWSRRRLVDVCCEIFSSRLLRFAPAQHSRRKHAGVPCLPLAFSGSTCYYSTCCPACVDKDSYPLCVRIGYFPHCICGSGWSQRASETREAIAETERRRTRDHSASSARGSRERRCEWCSVRNRLRDHRASCLETHRSRRSPVITVMVELHDRLS